jgi:peptidyl-prolyl cis-trans isomerase B (cyclophilin B)
VKAYPCTWTKSGTAARKVSVPPTTKPPRKGSVRVSVGTSQGAMTFTLDRAEAPCAVASFLSLAEQHYFDGTSCHRLTSGGLSVLQCGDPTGTGGGGPGYEFADELTGKEKYTRGVLAMANAGANTNGSQFFIVYKDSQLNPAYTVFGRVSRGLGVVDKVAAKGSTPTGDGKPKLPITLQKVTAPK